MARGRRAGRTAPGHDRFQGSLTKPSAAGCGMALTQLSPARLLFEVVGQLIRTLRVQHLALAVPEAGAPHWATDDAVHDPDLPVRPVALQRGHDRIIRVSHSQG